MEKTRNCQNVTYNLDTKRDILHERLYNFLKDKNPRAANEAIKKIKEGVDILQSTPYAGKPIEYMDAQFRAYAVPFGKRGYVVLYKNEGNDVFIMSVKHYLELEFIL